MILYCSVVLHLQSTYCTLLHKTKRSCVSAPCTAAPCPWSLLVTAGFLRESKYVIAAKCSITAKHKPFSECDIKMKLDKMAKNDEVSPN